MPNRSISHGHCGNTIPSTSGNGFQNLQRRSKRKAGEGSEEAESQKNAQRIRVHIHQRLTKQRQGNSRVEGFFLCALSAVNVCPLKNDEAHSAPFPGIQ